MGESEAQRPLYGRLMKAIDVQHTWGNRVGFVKLPLIMLDIKLYGGAIAQFYMVTEALEAQLERHADHKLVKHVRRAIGCREARAVVWLGGVRGVRGSSS